MFLGEQRKNAVLDVTEWPRVMGDHSAVHGRLQRSVIDIRGGQFNA